MQAETILLECNEAASDSTDGVQRWQPAHLSLKELRSGARTARRETAGDIPAVGRARNLKRDSRPAHMARVGAPVELLGPLVIAALS